MSLVCDGRPAKALLKLARRNGIEAPDNVTASELSNLLQERWLRKSEHQYQISGEPPSGEDLALLRTLGVIDAVPIPANGNKYRGALVLGGTVVAVRKRLAFLLEEYKWASFDMIYLLGGARPLDADKENEKALNAPAELPFKNGWTPAAATPETEAGMMRLVFEQSDLPAEWHGVVIDTPKQLTPDGKTRNPNTTDTVKWFMKTNPRPGAYLAVSSQPFVARQTLNVKQELPECFQVDGIGYAANTSLPLKTFCDEVARLLYEEVNNPCQPAAGKMTKNCSCDQSQPAEIAGFCLWTGFFVGVMFTLALAGVVAAAIFLL